MVLYWLYVYDGCFVLLIVITTVVSTKEFKSTEETLNIPNATISKDEIEIAEIFKSSKC